MTLGRLLGAAGAGAVLVLVAFLALISHEARNAPVTDCATVQVRPGQWRDAEPPDRVVLYGRYGECDRLRGLTQQQALAAFGEPERREGSEWAWRFVPGSPTFSGMGLTFGPDGRVTGHRRVRS